MPNEDECSGITPAQRARPTLLAWTQDLCDTAANAIELRWGSSAQQTPPPAGGEYRLLTKRDGDAWQDLGTFALATSSYRHAPGDFRLGATYAYRLTLESAGEEAPSSDESVVLRGCELALPRQLEGVDSCPPYLHLRVEYDEGRPEANHLRRLVLQRRDAAESTTQGIVPATHPLIRKAPGFWDLDDYGIRALHRYDYSLLADYGGRGVVYSPQTVTATVPAGCPNPSLAARAGNPAPSIELDWTWTPYTPAMDWYVIDFAIQRTPEPSKWPPSDWDLPDAALQPASVRHVLPPRGTEPESVLDENVLGNLTYAYQVRIQTAQGVLASQVARSRTTGPPWPVEELRAEARPTDSPGATHYPEDLEQHPDEYGVAVISWRNANDGGQGLTGYRLRWNQGDQQADCTLPASINRLVLPDEAPSYCSGPVRRFSPDESPANVTLWATNPHGAGLPVSLTSIRPWSMRSDGTQAARTNNDQGATMRTDYVHEPTRSLRTLPITPLGMQALSRSTSSPQRGAEAPTETRIQGQPCIAPSHLHLEAHRLEDDLSLGAHAALHVRPHPIEEARVRINAWDASFTTNGTRPDADSPAMLGKNWTLAAPWRGIDDPTPLHESQDWFLANWQQAFPSIPEAELGLPFNGVGAYCWLNGLIATGEGIRAQVPAAASRPSLGASTFRFRHTTETTGTLDQDIQKYAGIGAACLCIPIRDLVEEVRHTLQQLILSNATRIVLESRGSEAPLVGEPVLDWPQQDEVAQWAAAEARLQAQTETLVPERRLQQIRLQNHAQVLAQRWDKADTLPPTDLPSKPLDFPYALHAWLEIRPDLGLRDADGNWFVPANYTPLAFAGALTAPWREQEGEKGWSWSFAYRWGRQENGTWMDAPNAAAKGPARALSLEDYARNGGRETWRVNLTATLHDSHGRTASVVNLTTTATLRIDHLTIPGLPSRYLGVPAVKLDHGPKGEPLARTWWQPLPSKAAPWESSHLTRGRHLLDEGRTSVAFESPDPVAGLQSNEEAWPPSESSPEDEEAFRQTDSFLGFFRRLGDEPMRWTLADLRNLAAFSTSDETLGQAVPDNDTKDGYTAADGDQIHYRLFVRPTTTSGQVATDAVGEDAGLEDRTRINLTPHGLQDEGEEHAETINQWIEVQQDLPSGIHRQLDVVAQSYPEDALPADERVQTFYLDDIYIDSPSRQRRYPLFTYFIERPVQAGLAPQGTAASYATVLQKTGPFQEDPSILYDPTNPFLELLGLATDTPVANGALDQGWMNAGLRLALPEVPLPGGSAPYLQVQNGTLTSGPLPDGIGFGSSQWLPSHANYKAQVKLAGYLDWNSTNATTTLQPAYTYLDLIQPDTPPVDFVGRGSFGSILPYPVGPKLDGRPTAQTFYPGRPGSDSRPNASPFTALGSHQAVALDAVNAYDWNLTKYPPTQSWATEAARLLEEAGKTWLRIQPVPSRLEACVLHDGNRTGLDAFQARLRSHPLPAASSVTVQFRIVHDFATREPAPCRTRDPVQDPNVTAWPETGRILVWPESLALGASRQPEAVVLVPSINRTATLQVPVENLSRLAAYYDSPTYWFASDRLERSRVDFAGGGGGPQAMFLATVVLLVVASSVIRALHIRVRLRLH